jgi:TPP-dependent pyruvate/acetoin dehydrogenase alpha subunit
MTQSITHESILKAGRYAGVRIAADEAETAKALHRFMLRLRICEESLAREYHPADEMRCPVHFCVGQEAVPAALSLLLRDDDYLYCHHRSHGYYLAKNAPMPALFAELYGKSTGANAGLAGSQDISFAPGASSAARSSPAPPRSPAAARSLCSRRAATRSRSRGSANPPPTRESSGSR